MLVLHEPARGIGADGQDGGADGPVFGGQVAVGAAVIEACVADMQDFACGARDNKGGPKRHLAVARAAGGPMVAGFEMDGQRADLRGLAPIAGGDFGLWQGGVDYRVIAQRRDDFGGVGLVQALEGRKVKVVVVVMAEQDRIDFGQVVEGDTRDCDTFGTSKGQRAGACGPDRIGEQVHTGGLDKKCGVADHCDGHILHCWRGFGGGCRHRFGPCAALAIELPFQQVAQAARGRTVWVEKAGAIEMVGSGAAVVGFLSHAA